MSRMAVVGERDSILGFMAAGIEVYPASDGAAASREISRLAAEGCSVIFVTEKVARRCGEVLDRYKAAPYPAIIPIPDAHGTDGFGLSEVRRNVEKAVGADILFGEG